MPRYLVVALVLASSAIPAQAGWLGTGGPKLPKAVSFVQGAKGGGHGAPRVTGQDTKYGSAGWGSDWARRTKEPLRPLRPSLR